MAASGAKAQTAAVDEQNPLKSPAEINITSDSAPGWLPSAGQRQEVLKAANDFYSSLDHAQFERAYGMMAELNRRSVPVQEFSRRNREFQERSGPLKQRNFLKVTWTKDPAAAPFPGVYAAIDVASYFANVDRHCGYIVLYQKSADGRFEVMRQESNFIDNATAQNIERQRSRAALDTIWAKLAANCPNYKIPDSKS